MVGVKIMGRRKVAQRYAIWTERIHNHYYPETPFTIRDALRVLSEKYNTTYYPNARQMSMVLRGDDRFGTMSNLNNGVKLWYVRR